MVVTEEPEAVATVVAGRVTPSNAHAPTILFAKLAVYVTVTTVEVVHAEVTTQYHTLQVLAVVVPPSFVHVLLASSETVLTVFVPPPRAASTTSVPTGTAREAVNVMVDADVEP